MHTEEQAKEKQCATDPRGKCAGTACMGWRWSEARRTTAFVEAVQQRIREQSKPGKPYSHNKAIAEVYAEIGDKLVRTEGYCGVAGATK